MRRMIYVEPQSWGAYDVQVEFLDSDKRSPFLPRAKAQCFVTLTEAMEWAAKELRLPCKRLDTDRLELGWVAS
jgi:hypothetical protein